MPQQQTSLSHLADVLRTMNGYRCYHSDHGQGSKRWHHPHRRGKSSRELCHRRTIRRKEDPIQTQIERSKMRTRWPSGQARAVESATNITKPDLAEPPTTPPGCLTPHEQAQPQSHPPPRQCRRTPLEASMIHWNPRRRRGANKSRSTAIQDPSPRGWAPLSSPSSQGAPEERVLVNRRGETRSPGGYC
jgi:hypothetical protein